jgi:hypothetical protein
MCVGAPGVSQTRGHVFDGGGGGRRLTTTDGRGKRDAPRFDD